MYDQNIKDLKFVLYVRKSEENDDRQIQSIDDQIRSMKKLAEDLNIKIVDIFKESRSAKDPGRPEFNKMLEKIKNGDANGILCWQINRLTRNSIDGGTLQYLLQNEVIKCIKCSDKQYLPNDNALLLSIETGTANQFILDLKKNTKRGLQSKLEKGWMTGPAPIGYKNDKYGEQGDKKILIDEDRFSIIRKMWDLMLTGNYSAKKVCEIANEEFGLRTPQKKKIGGNKLSYSGIYRVFTSKFYMGVIVNKGIEYKGSHQAMITLSEFYKVQEYLGKKEKPMSHTKQFPYTGFIRCGVCGCMITAEEKIKTIKTTSSHKSYRYYRCTKKKEYLKCIEKPITESKLEEELKNLLLKCKILPKFRDWGIETLIEMQVDDSEKDNKININQNNNINDLQRQLDNLTNLRIRELINDDEFVTKKNKLKKEIQDINILLEKTKNKENDKIKELKKSLNYMAVAYENFNSIEYVERQNILRDIGKNYILKDGKVALDKKISFIEVEKEYPKLEQEYSRLELDKTLDDKEKIELLHSIKSVWGG